MPTCAQARPGSCPCCGAPSSPLGERLIIVGHGLVERQVQGPATADGVPEQGVVTLRRYRCRRCEAVLVVGPRGLVARRWYGAGAISGALAVFAGVDEHVKPQKTEQPGCQTTLAAGQRTGARESYFGVRTALLAFASCRPGARHTAKPVEFFPFPEVPAAAVAEGLAIAAACQLDVGGIEYLEAKDGRRIFYDINANSNLRPAIAQSFGFDPFERVVAYLRGQLEVASSRARAAVRLC